MPAAGVPWSYLPDLFVTNASHIFTKSADYNPTFPDVFTDAFNTSVDARVAAWVATDQHIKLPRVHEDVVGYYFEDQALWNVTQARTGPGSAGPRPRDWADAMRQKSPELPGAGIASAPGKLAYTKWLEQRYEARGGFAACRQVYSIPSSVAGFGALASYDFGGVDLSSAAVLADDNEFLGVVAERYFYVAASAVRRHDPGALVFGQRFIGQDIVAPVIAAAGRHFDVISVQPSPFSFDDAQEAVASAAELARISALAGGRPVFVADQTTHFVQRQEGLPDWGCRLDERGHLHGCAANATVKHTCVNLLTLHRSHFTQIVGVFRALGSFTQSTSLSCGSAQKSSATATVST